MPTQLFQQLPWVGGLNTSQDESMISSSQLTKADNVIFDTRGSRKKRDGIAQGWDSGTNAARSVVGEHDFWFGTSSKSQRMVSVMSDATVWSYNAGVRTQLTVGGSSWSGTLTGASMATFGNKCYIAVSGASNGIKYWDGSSSSIQDLCAQYGNSTLSRASSGTTRTLVFAQAFGLGDPAAIVGSVLVIQGCSNTSYNGTFTVASISTTTITGDTITYTGVGSLSESTAADTVTIVGKPGPMGAFLRQHLGRLWTNDKSNADRVHYCQTANPTVWLGVGDSGALDFGVGDGDPVGVTGMLPSFKQNFFVGKKTKMYRMVGVNPEDFSITLVSDGVGLASHNSCAAIDQEDVYWVSDRGVHSLSATNNYGDFDASYISVDIQKTFNEGFNRSRLSNVWGAYLGNINSVGFAFSTIGNSYNNILYFYNIPLKAWFTWSGITCESMIVANDTDKRRFYFGSNNGRICKSFTGNNYDLDTSGAKIAIQFQVTTGQIFVNSNPNQVKDAVNWTVTNPYASNALKRFILYYKPSGNHQITVNITVDNFRLNPENSLSFSQSTSTDLLGSTFILGTSVLGYTVVLGPYIRQIDGIGRGCKIDIVQNGIDEPLEIQGFAIEYESAGTGYETFLGQAQ